ncbi:hypothetical protein FTV88_0354 [Heliorestis convoluta]|uniref:Uncharacterized protein n=1 Tax=Heliorestis convoluta TaxID=356322 RepID=A0A5Q2MYP2_9FIRM|nr:hypothetical protein FTV88_0354 [Heliorestis convoluta]
MFNIILPASPSFSLVIAFRQTKKDILLTSHKIVRKKM